MTFNNTIKPFILAFVMASFIGSANAQDYTCGSDQVLEQWRQDNPDYLTAEQGGVYNNVRRDKIIIPIVFHVLHTNGSENISKQRILDQLEVLNQDFSATNSDTGTARNELHAPFKPLIANMEIEFALPKRDPQGRCTDGINRIYTTIGTNARDNVKKLVLWDPSRYLNIWVVSSINSSGADGTVLGFANFPWMSRTTDGVVVIASEVGKGGLGGVHGGRTLTHEIGHYLGLLHPFQGGCTFPNDHVDDTPLVKEQFSNANCPEMSNSCPLDEVGNELDTLYDMYENYMDYSIGCQNMFTIGQKERVDFYLHSDQYIRKNLWSTENLEFTGVTGSSNLPVASFSVDKKIICAGTEVTFEQVTCPGVPTTERLWTFEGGTPSTSTAANPKVTYNDRGFFKVSLKVKNANGEDSYEVDRYMEVYPNSTKQVGLFESFEQNNGPRFTTTGIWQVEEPGYSRFKIVETGHTGKTSVKAPITPFNFGERFALETPSLDMTPMENLDPKLSFMVAYAKRNPTAIDNIRVMTSRDCGATWQQILIRNSSFLSSYEGFATGFVPESKSDWVRIEAPLSSVRNSSNVKIRIIAESGGGNPIYIDDINISQYYTSATTIEKPLDALIFPNPANNTFTVQLSSYSANTTAKVSVWDVNGKELAELHNGAIDGNNANIVVNPKDYNLVAGIYFVKIQTADGITTQKLVLTD